MNCPISLKHDKSHSIGIKHVNCNCRHRWSLGEASIDNVLNKIIARRIHIGYALDFVKTFCSSNIT